MKPLNLKNPLNRISIQRFKVFFTETPHLQVDLCLKPYLQTTTLFGPCLPYAPSVDMSPATCRSTLDRKSIDMRGVRSSRTAPKNRSPNGGRCFMYMCQVDCAFLLSSLSRCWILGKLSNYWGDGNEKVTWKYYFILIALLFAIFSTHASCTKTVNYSGTKFVDMKFE